MKNTTKILVLILSLAVIFGALVLVTSADGNVARIGDTEYSTLSDAIAAAQSGDTITLIADASVAMETKEKDDTNEKGETVKVYDPDNSAVTIGKNLTIDLGGYKLTTACGFIVIGNYEFTITGEGEILYNNSAESARMIYASSNEKGNPIVTVSGTGKGITVNTNPIRKPNLFEMHNAELNVKNADIITAPGYEWTFTVFDIYGSSTLNFYNSSVNSTAQGPIPANNNQSKIKTTRVIHLHDTSVANIKYVDILANHTVIDIENTSGRTIDGRENVICNIENSYIANKYRSDKEDVYAFGIATSKLNGDIVIKNSELLAGYRIFSFMGGNGIHCYNTQLFLLAAREGACITRSNDVYLYDGSELLIYPDNISATPVSNGEKAFVYLAPGARVRRHKDTRDASIKLWDPETDATYDATYNGKNGAETVVAKNGELTFLRDPYTYRSPYVVGEYGTSLPVSDIVEVYEDVYTMYNGNVLKSEISEETQSYYQWGLANFGLANWFNFGGKVTVATRAENNNSANTCLRYEVLSGSTHSSQTGRTTNMMFGRPPQQGIDVFDENYKVFVVESGFATDTGSFLPFYYDLHVRDEKSGDTHDMIGLIAISVDADGTARTSTGIGVNETKAYTDGRWNTVQYVIYKYDEKGNSIDQGMVYAYLNGVLIGYGKAYDGNSNGTSYLFGPRYDLKSVNNITNEYSLLIDDVVIKALCNEIAPEGAAGRGDYAHDSSYFTNGVKLGSTSFSDVNEAIAEAGRLGTVAQLEGTAYANKAITNSGTAVANGYELKAYEGSGAAFDTTYVGGAPAAYTFGEKYADDKYKVTVTWDNTGKTSTLYPGQIPLVQDEKDGIPDYTNFVADVHVGWTADKWTDGEPSEFGLYNFTYLTVSDIDKITDKAVLMTAIIEESKPMTAVLIGTDGNYKGFTTSTELCKEGSMFYDFAPGYTLKLLQNVNASYSITLGAGTYTVDLNDFILWTPDSNGAFHLSTDASTELIIENGTISSAESIVELSEAAGASAEHSVQFNNVTFYTDTTDTLILIRVKPTAWNGKSASLNIKFNKCKFDYSKPDNDVTILSDSVGAVKSTMEFYGGNLTTQNVDELYIIAGQSDNDSYKFCKDDTGVRTTLTFGYTESAPTVKFMTDEGEKPIVFVDDGNYAKFNINGSVTYMLSDVVEKKYGMVPEAKKDASFLIFYGDYYLGSDDSFYNANGKVRSLLSAIDGPCRGKTVVILLNVDDHAIDKSYENLAQIDGTLLLDLDGRTLSATKDQKFFMAVSKSFQGTLSHTTVKVIGGTLLTNNASAVGLTTHWDTGSSGHFMYDGTKPYSFIFEDVTFGAVEGMGYNKAIETTLYDDRHTDGKKKLTNFEAVFNGCVFNMPESGILFDFLAGDNTIDGETVNFSHYITSSVTVNGGTIDMGSVGTEKLNGIMQVHSTNPGTHKLNFTLDENGKYTYASFAGEVGAPTATFYDEELELGFIKANAEKTLYTLAPTVLKQYSTKMSITLAASLEMNIYVPVLYTASLELDGKTYTDLTGIKRATVGGVEYYVFTVKLSAPEAASEVKLTSSITIKNYSTNGTFTFSIPKYATKVINNQSRTEAEKTLVKDVIAYIRDAYTYFGKDAAAITALNTILDGYNRTAPADTSNKSTITNEYIKEATFNLTATPAVRFTLADGKNVGAFSFYVGEKYVPFKIGDGYVELYLYAYQMCEEIKCYYNGTSIGAYHISSYYEWAEGQTAVYPKLPELVISFWKYALSAKEYANAE